MASPEMTNGPWVKGAAIVKIIISASSSRAENNLTSPTCPAPVGPRSRASWSRAAAGGGGHDRA
jgi:hypothetical protein